jgi:preprotein translocase, SecE subunit, bacterial
MAKAKSPTGRRNQDAQPAMAGHAVAADAPAPKKRTTVLQFISQVRAEARKIVWPSRKETWITSVMVFLMVVLASLFFLAVDWALAMSTRFVLGLGT